MLYNLKKPGRTSDTEFKCNMFKNVSAVKIRVFMDV